MDIIREKNLILTYETAESPLDPMDVEHEIEKNVQVIKCSKNYEENL